MKVTINYPEVKIFVIEAESPSLMVKHLSEQKSGKIAFRAGNGAGGDFANLKIVPK
ncbi:hypothetical protein JW964_10545 [candidate division KSB1 bacterium]|nr:hypothetical protein [candidate division KSB1 bacterium]